MSELNLKTTAEDRDTWRRLLKVPLNSYAPDLVEMLLDDLDTALVALAAAEFMIELLKAAWIEDTKMPADE